jgi:hypothetical protein
MMTKSGFFLEQKNNDFSFIYRGPACSDNLNAPTIVISPSCRVVTVLIFIIFSLTETTSTDKSVTYEMIGLEESSPKMP